MKQKFSSSTKSLYTFTHGFKEIKVIQINTKQYLGKNKQQNHT